MAEVICLSSDDEEAAVPLALRLAKRGGNIHSDLVDLDNASDDASAAAVRPQKRSRRGKARIASLIDSEEEAEADFERAPAPPPRARSRGKATRAAADDDRRDGDGGAAGRRSAIGPSGSTDGDGTQEQFRCRLRRQHHGDGQDHGGGPSGGSACAKLTGHVQQPAV